MPRIGVVLLIVLLAGAAQIPGDFDCFAVSDLEKVFDDGYNLPAASPARVELFGIRSETISGQFVIRANRDLKQVTAGSTGLRASQAGANQGVVPVAWNFVGSVPVPANTANTLDRYLIRKAPGRFPDYLAEERAADIPAGQYRAVWLTVAIAKDAGPGVYEGAVTVRANDASRDVPVRLEVLPLDMPARRHLAVTHWYRASRLAKYHDAGEAYSDAYWSVLAAYAADMAAHRQNVFRADMDSIISRRDASGAYSFDFSRFDRWAEIFFQAGMDMLETGFVGSFGEGGFSSPNIVFRRFRVEQGPEKKTVSVDGAELLPHLMPALERHLAERGWLEKTVFHVADEPSNHNLASWREMSRTVHEWAPRIRRIDAIEATGFQGALEVWVPKLNHLNTWFTDFKDAQRRGNELWFYTCMHPTGAYPNRFIDFPLIATRVLHWLNYRYGITGYLHWGWNAWTEDPFTVMNEARLGPGDAWAVYPKKNGVIDSIRWETLRNGLQDYECLWLLEDRFAKLKQSAGLDWLIASQRGLELAGRVVPSMERFTRDPRVLYAARRQALEEILDLDSKPRLVVQSNPPEGAAILYGPASIELHVWSDPGAEILLNGRPVAVDAGGAFHENVSVRPGRSTIEVKARLAGVEKTATRNFQVLE
jgi:hypothetical protein